MAFLKGGLEVNEMHSGKREGLLTERRRDRDML
jgi:hypothetical protein